MKLNLLASAAALSIAMAAPAHAAVALFDFTLSDPAAGLGSGPYGTVQVTENAGNLDFLYTLNSGFRIHDGNDNHNAFTFSLVGDPTVTISNLTAGFSAIATASGINVSAPPFGDYETGIDCSSACGPGFGGGFAGPLSFTVDTVAPLTLASLAFNTVGANNVYFTSDLVISNGNTGNVGAVFVRRRDEPPGVPEPSTWALMLVGFGAIGAMMRKRSHRVQLRYV